LRHLKMYERCKVVRVNGTGKLQSIGLVGQWPEYDLPHRTDSGDIQLGQLGSPAQVLRVLRPASMLEVSLPVEAGSRKPVRAC
jgi:hypothetical protein